MNWDLETPMRMARTMIKAVLALVFLVLYVITGTVDAMEWWWNDMMEWLEADYRE